MPELIGTDSRDTLPAWTTHLTVRFLPSFRKILIQVVETIGNNAADWRVQAASDEDFTNPHTLTDENGVSEFDLPADTSQTQSLCDCSPWVRVQARIDAGVGLTATLTVNISGG